METKNNNQLLVIGAWVCFVLGLFLADYISVIGAILGHYYWKNGGTRIPFWANIGVIALSFFIGFIIGIVGSI